MVDKVLCFVGCSGTGKTTLLKYLKEKHNLETVELGGRRFLSETSSYDVQVEDTIQSQIAYVNTATILLEMLKNKGTTKLTCFSRSPIDVMAYEKVLKKAEFLLPYQTEILDKIRDRIIWIYLPIEFPLMDTDDIKRGMNESVRTVTDYYIQELLFSNRINYYTVKGSIEERQKQLDFILSETFNNL